MAGEARIGVKSGGSDLLPASAPESPLSSHPPSAAPQPPPLIDPTFLFRFELELLHHAVTPGPEGLELPESCRIPSLSALSGPRRDFADVRMAWDDDGLAFAVEVTGKKSLPWCRTSRLEDSDGFQLWIDSRCSPGIHRATQYCHHFLFMPTGGGPDMNRAIGGLLPINRARQNPNAPKAGTIQVHAKIGPSGYRLSGKLKTAAITGFDSRQFRRLGFFYAAIDRELGWQTLCLNRDYPFAEDPSLWAEAVLSDEKSSK